MKTLGSGSYASRLKDYPEKGICGLPELSESSCTQLTLIIESNPADLTWDKSTLEIRPSSSLKICQSAPEYSNSTQPSLLSYSFID